MIHPWLQSDWKRLVALDARLPHALLFAGPPGLGKRDLANALAARSLCDAPDDHGEACGQCSACVLRLSGNHPDLFLLVPESEREANEAADDVKPDKSDDAAAKAKSTQIVIEQVRALQRALSVTGHQSARRAIIVDPAEGMNVFTANALLKLLEEPPAGCLFILVSSAPRALLPTIRSRCQVWSFARPAALAAGRDPALAELLALCGGLPLAAERLAAAGGAAMLKRFVADLAKLPGADPLRLAAQWEQWLKSKEALAAGFGMVQLTDWMQRWVTDVATLRLGGQVRYFPTEAARIAALAARASIAQVTTCYNDVTAIRRVARHPLNARLVLEDMLLRYVRGMGGSRS